MPQVTNTGKSCTLNLIGHLCLRWQTEENHIQTKFDRPFVPQVTNTGKSRTLNLIGYLCLKCQTEDNHIQTKSDGPFVPQVTNRGKSRTLNLIDHLCLMWQTQENLVLLRHLSVKQDMKTKHLIDLHCKDTNNNKETTVGKSLLLMFKKTCKPAL